MQVDKTTLQDISIFHREEEQSVFYHLNRTQTNGGREYLRWLLSKPLDSIADITDAQHTIKDLLVAHNKLPATITNGTIMVIESFLEAGVDNYPSNPNIVNSLMYKVASAADYSITKYSTSHFVGFVKDLQTIASLLLPHAQSKQIATWCERINLLLQRPVLQTILQWQRDKKLSPTEVLWLGRYVKLQFKQQTQELLEIYNKLDAYTSLALACNKYHFVFPLINESKEPFIKAEGLYHLLLEKPVSYDVTLNKDTNFMFLTGANMAGKSTFIKGVGICIYLAHIGMGVPAKAMEISLFDGLLTNIQVEDNIIKGESYFFNEVQRIKRTVDKLSDGKKWLILIDELFKGTNVQDAMKCSLTVIEGLRKTGNALFVLSTHLYEIAEPLQQYSNIDFRYFETSVLNDQLVFGYHLQKGVSNDRLGYLILKREGVIEMLEQL